MKVLQICEISDNNFPDHSVFQHVSEPLPDNGVSGMSVPHPILHTFYHSQLCLHVHLLEMHVSEMAGCLQCSPSLEVKNGINIEQHHIIRLALY